MMKRRFFLGIMLFGSVNAAGSESHQGSNTFVQQAADIKQEIGEEACNHSHFFQSYDSIEGHTFSDFSLNNLNCADKQFIGCLFENITFEDTDFSSALFRGCFFKNCMFRRCNFQYAMFKKLIFRGEEAHTVFIRSRFIECSFRVAQYEGALLVKTFFKYCNFEYLVSENSRYIGISFKHNTFSHPGFASSYFLSCSFLKNKVKDVSFYSSLIDRCYCDKTFLRASCCSNVVEFCTQKRIYEKRYFLEGRIKTQRVLVTRKFNQEETACCICTEAFNEQDHKRMWLFCGHSCCYQCSIRHLIFSEQAVPRCPFCAQDFLILQKNGLINDIIARLSFKRIVRERMSKEISFEWVCDSVSN